MWKVYENHFVRGASRIIVTDKFPESVEDVLDLETYECNDGYKDMAVTKTGIETIIIEEGIYGLKVAVAEIRQEKLLDNVYAGANLVALTQIPDTDYRGIAGCIFYDIFDIVAIAGEYYNERSTIPFSAKYKFGKILEPTVKELDG